MEGKNRGAICPTLAWADTRSFCCCGLMLKSRFRCLDENDSPWFEFTSRMKCCKLSIQKWIGKFWKEKYKLHRKQEETMWRIQHTRIGFLVSLTRFSSPNESCDYLQRLLCPLETLTAAAPRRDAQQPMQKLFRDLQRELELIRECVLCRQKMLILTKYIELN